MGAVVSSEALRREADPGDYGRPNNVQRLQLVKAYIPSQGATVANAYSANVADRGTGWDTADVYKICTGWSTLLDAANPSNPINSRPYFADIHMSVAPGGLINFYNPGDYALGGGPGIKKPWEINQDLKPRFGYYYDPQGNYFWRDTGGVSGGTRIELGGLETWSIFSYAAEGHSLPLGRQSGVGGFDAEVNLNAELGALGFGDSDAASHSAQFMSTKCIDQFISKNCWRILIIQFKIHYEQLISLNRVLQVYKASNVLRLSSICAGIMLALWKLGLIFLLVSSMFLHREPGEPPDGSTNFIFAVFSLILLSGIVADVVVGYNFARSLFMKRKQWLITIVYSTLVSIFFFGIFALGGILALSRGAVHVERRLIFYVSGVMLALIHVGLATSARAALNKEPQGFPVDPR